jgi:serine/threonine protein kinase
MITALNWTLGPYRIAREIDRGHFGTVYEATDADQRQIALKLVPVQGADSDAKVSAERQGAVLQQRFSRTYRHLVPEVLDHQRIDPYYAIAMELVSGEPLTTVIEAGRVPSHRAATIALAICRFLEKAHEFTTHSDDHSETLIVHGDLKPAHILLLPDGSIRVLDFGIAKALAARKSATTNKWGSVDYASPERLELGRVNEQADFWSLGVILFEMLSGCRPYLHYEHNQSRLETAIRRQEPRVSVPPDVDSRLTAIVDKLLASQIEQRYQSASEIARDLQAFLDGHTVVAGAEAPRVIPRSASTVPTEPLPSVALPARGVVATDAFPRALPRAESRGVTIPSLPPIPPQPPFPPAPPRRQYKPGTAAVLSLILPGLGQVYNGDYLRGIVWLLITLALGSAGVFPSPLHVIAAFTAYRRARRAAFLVVPPSRPRVASLPQPFSGM